MPVRAPSCLSKLYFHSGEDVMGGSGVLIEARVAPSLLGKAQVIKPVRDTPFGLAGGCFQPSTAGSQPVLTGPGGQVAVAVNLASGSL